SFPLESGFFKYADRTHIARNTGRFDAVQPHGRESVGDEGAHGVLHVAPSGMALAGPVADLRRLRDAVADVAEGDPADELTPLVLEDQIGDRAAREEILPHAAHAPTPARALQLVARPSRLPRLEEVAAFVPQRRPFEVVRAARRVQ